MIIQLYPNVEVFEHLQHSDDHVMWVEATNEQIEVFSSMDWLICTGIDGDGEGAGIDFDITEQGVRAAFVIAGIMLHNLQGEIQV